MQAKWCRHVVLSLVGAAAVAGGVGAQAADGQPGVVALIVDARRIMIDSKAGKAIQAQMQQQASAYQKSVGQQEQELIAAQQELQRQQTILSQDAFEAKRKEFEQRYAEARKRAQDAQNELLRAEQQAQDKERATLQEVLTGLAKERGANFVFDKSTVLLFDGHFDVTDEAMKRFDEKLPTVTVNFTSGGAAPASPGAPAAPAAGGKTPPPKKKS
jgi:Skp family chaperone for outer membrane proteins